jgi:polar amino acid transport system substrate-binding protein
MRDDQGKGFIGTSTDMVKNALNSAGIKFSITAMPWARALMTVRSEKDTCAFSVSRTPEREDLFKWVSIVAENKWVLFAKRSRGLKISSLEQARPLVIGTYVGDAIEKFLNKNGYRIQVTGSDELNLDKLENNRIDLWATGELVGRHFIAKHNQNGFEKVLEFGKTKMYLACNMDLPDSIARQIALAIDEDHPTPGRGGPVMNQHASPN